LPAAPTTPADPPLHILLAEDDPSTSELLQTFLEGHGYIVATVTTGRHAVDQLRAHPFDLVLSDLAMPGGDGFELVQEVREMGLVDLPFLLMSANYESVLRVQGLNLGADDFLLKPLDLDELLARVQSHLRRSDRKTQLARESAMDPLTRVLNRRGISEYFESERTRREERGHDVAALVIDLDHFKEINDTHGHATGDVALCAVAHALEQTVRSSDRVGRLGGDEFVVVMSDTDAANSVYLAERVRALSPLQVELDEHSPDSSPTSGDAREQRIKVGFSVGLATGGASTDLDSLLSTADAQMYARKRAKVS